MIKTKTLPAIPIYCKDCGSRNSWKRNPSGDWIAESGKIIQESFLCTVCGATTIRPPILNNKRENN